jgi:hypothetical protein
LAAAGLVAVVVAQVHVVVAYLSRTITATTFVILP